MLSWGRRACWELKAGGRRPGWAGGEEAGKASQMAGTAWAKAQGPQDEQCTGGLSSYSLALALPSEQQK